MTTLLISIGKTSLALGIIYLFYRYVLSKDKLFRRNRFYLISASIMSFILPWISIPISESESQVLSFAYIVNGNQLGPQLVQVEKSAFPWVRLIMYMYISGIAIFFSKTILSYFQVFRIIKSASHKSLGEFKIVTTARNLSPFSFFRWIVIPSHINHNHPSYEKMIQHEMIHCRQYHSADLFIAELLIILQWFNPFAWLLRRAISENLEYLVDEEMLRKGTNVRDYQYSLLSFSVVGLKPAVANNFNSNLLKKRITMMNTSKCSRNYRLNNFLIPFCLAITMLLTVSFQKHGESPDTLVPSSEIKIVDQSEVSVKESFQSEDKITASSAVKASEKVSSVINNEELILGYILNNVRYPKEAIDINLQGVVEIPVKFGTKGVEILQTTVTGERLKQVVVVGYATDETGKNAPVDGSSPAFKLIQDEVVRVLTAFKNIPESLVGKTYIVSVKFMLEGMKEVGYGQGDDAKIIVRHSGFGTEKRTFVLNNQKIISQEEMQSINLNSIKSIQVYNDGMVHKTLGTLDGGVIFITTK